MYIAHRALDDREQSVEEHLRGTAKLAAQFAESFGCQDFAYQIGLAHDAGKYSNAFQRRIRGGALEVDHSTAGAQEFWKAFGLIFGSYCIAGHHGGLPDGGSRYDDSSQPTLFARLGRQVEAYDAFGREITLRRVPFRAPKVMGKGGFTAAFWTRMLFSCLVDADYLDTEAFMNGGAPPRGEYDGLDELLARLQTHVEPWWKTDNTLNLVRCEILRACFGAGAAQKPGLFTLTVPTGGGKTVSSLAFALNHAVAHGLRRVIYVAPYTSIIDQTAETFREILGERSVLEHHSGVDYDDLGDDSDVSRKKLATENWDMPVVVTTAVQFFESLFASKPSRCRKLHNLAQSVIIFDEAQTIPLPYLKPCVRAIAELSVNYGATCVLCTATQPALGPLFREVDPGLAPREICPPVDWSVFERVRYVRLREVSDEALAERLRAHRQALCVVSTRKQAQAVFSLLDSEGSFHLSTRMTPEHRRAVLAEIRAHLDNKKPCRVVSTSLIEAGVNVDFPVAYRAEAGLESVIQTGGRCNRNGKNPAEESIVYVFAPEKKYLNVLPDELRMPIDVARSIMWDCVKPDAPEAIKRYFTQVYQNRGNSLDKMDIVPAFEEADQKSFPFASVADRFRLIDSQTRSILIPRDDASWELAERLRAGERSRKLFRKLGRYSVGVYIWEFEALNALGALEILDEDAVILCDPMLYDERTGLIVPAEGGQGIFQ